MPQLSSTTMNAVREINFDGLVGPTHHYGGLGRGNLASQRHRHQVSSPRRAALEGLAKMKRLADRGIGQAVLPPHDRPDVNTLRRLGFTGSDADVLTRAAREAPDLLSACASASAMWAANAATVSAGPDTADGRLHLTPANLSNQLHRAIETPTTAAVLRTIFPGAQHFARHEPLPATPCTADEGAANHTRLCAHHGAPGVEIFAYGRGADRPAGTARFTPRQARQASEAVARLHRLDPSRTLFVHQHPEAIDAGVFHNDVIALGNENVLLYHESAFAEGEDAVDRIRAAFRRITGGELVTLRIDADELPLEEAVATYLFNSQLLTLPEGGMLLLCPAECRTSDRARACLQRIAAGENPIREVEHVPVRQSMRNGGGPACLRLRIVMDERQRRAMHGGVLLDDALYRRLVDWVERHYRDELCPEHLADPHLLDESRTALDELTRILGLGAPHPFQRRGA